IDFKIISFIFGFSLNMYPVVTKEIKITSNHSNHSVVKKDISVSEHEDVSIRRRKDKKSFSKKE
ncbi:unnamed protein product, partial [marine sediment metagenome]